jgi:hypothetical protein
MAFQTFTSPGLTPEAAELFRQRTLAINELDREIKSGNNATNPKFWERILTGENINARKAFVCNNGISHLAIPASQGGCVNTHSSNTRDVEAYALTEGSQGYRLAGAEVFMHHIYPIALPSKESGHIRLMRINFGKMPRSKTIPVSANLNKTPGGSHRLTLMEESSQTWIQQPNETTKLPQPGLRNGLSFNTGHNTAQALLRTAMNMCHLHGKTDPEDYNFAYERLLAHTGAAIHQRFSEWKDKAKSPNPGLKFDLRADPFIFTADRTAAYRIDKLAVWFPWDNQKAAHQFRTFLP